MLLHVDQPDKKLTSAVKNHKDNNSTIHFLLMPSHTGKTLGIVGNSETGTGRSWLVCAVECVEIRDLEDQAERINHAATLSSMQQLNICGSL